MEVLCFLPSTHYALYDFDLRATHARTLLPAALASVSFGFVLVRVRVLESKHARNPCLFPMFPFSCVSTFTLRLWSWMPLLIIRKRTIYFTHRRIMRNYTSRIEGLCVSLRMIRSGWMLNSSTCRTCPCHYQQRH